MAQAVEFMIYVSEALDSEILCHILTSYSSTIGHGPITNKDKVGRGERKEEMKRGMLGI